MEHHRGRSIGSRQKNEEEKHGPRPIRNTEGNAAAEATKMPEQLAAALTACLRERRFPAKWKTARVVLLKKPNKPEREPSSNLGQYAYLTTTEKCSRRSSENDMETTATTSPPGSTTTRSGAGSSSIVRLLSDSKTKEGMFSFHKPKVYRSTTGCCICKAKSSSSRFTDSRKYEEDLMECFQLGERRTGEICNACVLLVKRWKKLPDGSDRNWRHVVDARAGPGTKSLAKFKAKNKNKKKPKLKAEVREISPAPSDELSSDLSGLSVNSSSRPCSPAPSEECIPKASRKRPKSPLHLRDEKHRRSHSPVSSGFVDLDFWKKKKVCCGTIFTGPHGMVMVDPRLLKPCQGCRDSKSQRQASLSPAQHMDFESRQTKKDKVYSDSSSDSGYDDSSNPGAPSKTNTVDNPPDTVMCKPVLGTGKPLPLFLSQPHNNLAQIN